MMWYKIHQDMTLFLAEGFFKTAVIIFLLILIYYLKDRINTKAEASPIQPSQWDLLAAYKVYIPGHLLVFVFNTWWLYGTSLRPHVGEHLILASIIVGTILCIPSIAILLLFFIIIKRPFNVRWSNIGIDFKSFTHKALPILIFIISIYIVYVVIKSSNITANLNIKLIALPGVLLISVVEELLFRSILLQSFVKKINVHLAVLTTSVCWSFFHPVSWAAHITIIIFGIFLSWTYLKSKTILVPMTIHATTNVIKILIFL